MGPLFDRLLIENGFRLYNVDNLKLKRFKEMFGGEWRNDRVRQIGDILLTTLT